MFDSADRVLSGGLVVAGGVLALDGLELADEIGHLLGAERGRYGAMTAQRLGRVEVRIRRLPSGQSASSR